MKSFKYAGSQVRQYWKTLMESHHRKMSCGAEYLTRLITSAHGDGWRRKNNKKSKHSS